MINIGGAFMETETAQLRRALAAAIAERDKLRSRLAHAIGMSAKEEPDVLISQVAAHHGAIKRLRLGASAVREALDLVEAIPDTEVAGVCEQCASVAAALNGSLRLTDIEGPAKQVIDLKAKANGWHGALLGEQQTSTALRAEVEALRESTEPASNGHAGEVYDEDGGLIGHVAPAEPIVQITRLRGAPMPAYQTDGAAGMDLVWWPLEMPDALPHVVVEGEPLEFKLKNLTIPSACRVTVGTGIALAIPPGYEGQIRSRSGLTRDGYLVAWCSVACGTIDSDYRGEVAVTMYNNSTEPLVLHAGDRIAQLVIAPVARARLVETADLPPTKRGEGGFGSTGR